MARFVMALLAFVTLSASAQQKGETFLTEKELRTLMSQTLTVDFFGYNRRGTGVYQKDGTVRLNSTNWTAVGSWKIEGNKLCTNYTEVGSGCNKLQKTGANSYKLIPDDGSTPGTWEVKKGK